MIQKEDDGLWTDGKILEKGYHNHNHHSYEVWVTKTGWLIARKSKHVKITPITAEQYLKDQLSKDPKKDTLEGIVRCFENQAQKDENYTYTLNIIRPPNPTTISEIEKFYMEAQKHPDNQPEKYNYCTINAK